LIQTAVIEKYPLSRELSCAAGALQRPFSPGATGAAAQEGYEEERMIKAVFPELQGKVVLVTGATRGIGKEIARAFAGQRCAVAATGRDVKAGREIAEELAGMGAKAVFEPLDVTDRAQAEKAVAKVQEELGVIEILVNNAGVSDMHRVVDLGDESWDRNMDVNAKGTFIVSQLVVRRMIDRGIKGRIINVSSAGGKLGAPFLAHYCASKFAVVGFTQSLALEVAAHGIRVNAVCPTWTRTSMQEREIVWESRLRGISPNEVMELYVKNVPLGRVAEPEDVAKVVLFFASDLADFLTGQAVNVCGGNCMV
jgi:NAD(P)-dependent dehydrogenase (short-subunit alcohol dehydrogenase family)